MTDPPEQITLEQWEQRYPALLAGGLIEPAYGGPLGRHVRDGDYRLEKLRFDNSPAALRLWNFLLSEEQRLFAARDAGQTIVGVMKDLGTTAVMAYALDDVVAFYPDGAWWIPCVMELHAGLLAVADSLGIDESFCPVRAMLGAFTSAGHFPTPDLLTCSVGAVCDDFSAIAQRLNGLGFPILWWEMPARRRPDPGEPAVTLPGGFRAPRAQVDFLRGQLQQVRAAMEGLTGQALTDDRLAAGIEQANRVRHLLGELRRVAYAGDTAVMGGLEMLIAEMLAIHYCSDRDETIAVLTDLLAEARRRADAGADLLGRDAARVFWVNPVPDLRAMNLLEACGGRVCGSEYLFCHAMDPIPEDLPPMEALARMALADPMVGPAADRAQRVCADVRRYGAEAVLLCRIPGASHCATEGAVIAEAVRAELDLPVVEMEVPPLTDSIAPALRTRLEALTETAKERRTR